MLENEEARRAILLVGPPLYEERVLWGTPLEIG